MLRLLVLLVLLFASLALVSPAHAARPGAEGRSNSAGVQVLAAVGTDTGVDAISLAGLHHELGWGPHWAAAAGVRLGADEVLVSIMGRHYQGRGRARFFGVGAGVNERGYPVALGEVGLRIPLGRFESSVRGVGGYAPTDGTPLVIGEASLGMAFGVRNREEREQRWRERLAAWGAL